MLRLGIVGLPNVGKSTLFNALTSAGALVANYPFATIEPNTGVVTVPDPRLDELARLVAPERTVPATVEFLDIAGLVKGASQGEGLGNQFLANIREVDAVVHVIRAFDDPDIQHVMGVDRSGPRPRGDQHRARPGGSRHRREAARPHRAHGQVRRPAGQAGAAAPRSRPRGPRRGKARPCGRADGRGARDLAVAQPPDRQAGAVRGERGRRATSCSGNAYVDALRAALERDREPAEIVIFSAKVEAELAELAAEDRGEFLHSLGLTESGLDRLAHAAYHLLGLQSYFTAGEKEVRAWTIHQGDKAPAAAGVIHSDFEKGFIRAETVGYDDFVRAGGWKGAREQGLARAEGKEYVVRDGDVMLFRFSS